MLDFLIFHFLIFFHLHHVFLRVEVILIIVNQSAEVDFFFFLVLFRFI